MTNALIKPHKGISFFTWTISNQEEEESSPGHGENPKQLHFLRQAGHLGPSHKPPGLKTPPPCKSAPSLLTRDFCIDWQTLTAGPLTKPSTLSCSFRVVVTSWLFPFAFLLLLNCLFFKSSALKIALLMFVIKFLPQTRLVPVLTPINIYRKQLDSSKLSYTCISCFPLSINILLDTKTIHTEKRWQLLFCCCWV